MFEDHLDVKSACGDSLGIFRVKVISYGFAKVIQPHKDILRRNVRVLKDCNENFVTYFWLRNGVVADDFPD